MKSLKQSSHRTQNSKNPSWEIIPAQDYFKRLALDMDAATKHVAIKTMTYKTGPEIARVEAAMQRAVSRGVSVEFHLDRYSILEMNIASFKALRKLRKSGVHIQWHGRIKLNPFAGRSHSKFAVIDRSVYTFGGLNFKESSATHRDFMLHLQDASLASYLLDIGAHTHSETHFPWGDVIYDAGKPHRSPILERALQLARSAQSITYISKMAPDGQILKQIQRANGTAYYNSIQSSRTSIMTKLAALLAGRGSAPKNAYPANQSYLHMKCLLLKNKDGAPTVVTGSHNFSSLGARFGTEELALVSHDPALYTAITAQLP